MHDRPSVASRSVDLEIHDRGAAGRHRHGLYAAERRRAEARAFVHAIKDLADDVERRSEIWAADAEEDAHRLTERARRGWALVSAPTDPLNRKYSGRSEISFS